MQASIRSLHVSLCQHLLGQQGQAYASPVYIRNQVDSTLAKRKATLGGSESRWAEPSPNVSTEVNTIGATRPAVH